MKKRVCQRCKRTKNQSCFHSLPKNKWERKKLQRKLTKAEYRDTYIHCISCCGKAKRMKLWKQKNQENLIKSKDLKEKLVDLHGGKCAICGYNKSKRGLHFHHLNSGEKEFNISESVFSGRSIEEIVLESHKCMLLCSNCHAEVHEKVIKIPQEIIQSYKDCGII